MDHLYQETYNSIRDSWLSAHLEPASKLLLEFTSGEKAPNALRKALRHFPAWTGLWADMLVNSVQSVRSDDSD